MKIRLMGTQAEIAAISDAISTVLDIREISEFYPNRGSSTLGRVYLDVVPRSGVVRADAERADRPPRRGLPGGRGGQQQ